MDLKDRIAVITGGGGGIGKAMGRAFLERGARVVLADISKDRAEAVAAELGGGSFATQLDVTSARDWASLKGWTERQLGPVDILCCNAGVGHSAPLDAPDLSGFRWVHEVNLIGPLMGLDTFLPGMKNRGAGHVVFSCSITALRPVPGQSAYSSSKAALANVALTLEQELRGSGVGVSALMPGMVITELRANSDEAWAEKSGSTAAPAATTSALAAGMPAEAVGRAVSEAVAEGRFWIFPHDGYQPVLAREVQLALEAMALSPMPDHRDPAALLEPMH